MKSWLYDWWAWILIVFEIEDSSMMAVRRPPNTCDTNHVWGEMCSSCSSIALGFVTPRYSHSSLSSTWTNYFTHENPAFLDTTKCMMFIVFMHTVKLKVTRHCIQHFMETNYGRTSKHWSSKLAFFDPWLRWAPEIWLKNDALQFCSIAHTIGQQPCVT